MSTSAYRRLSTLVFFLLVIATSVMQSSPGFFAIVALLTTANTVLLHFGNLLSERNFKHASMWFISLQSLHFLAYLITFIVWGCTDGVARYSLTVETVVACTFLLWWPMFMLLHHGSTQTLRQFSMKK